MLTRSFSTEVPELKFNQEKADTCFMLHTKHASDNRLQNVIVINEDVEVIALLLEIVDLLNGQLF